MTTQKLQVGKVAPAFTLVNHHGNKVSLKDFKGTKNVIVYFYPKAMTPGCTVQAQGMRDFSKQFSRIDTVVLAISPDSPERLAKFSDKEGLDFDLLSDEDHKIADKYGVWALKKNYGKEYMGIVRTTFIIDKNGKIKHIMDRVKTKSHHQDVLEIVRSL